MLFEEPAEFTIDAAYWYDLHKWSINERGQGLRYWCGFNLHRWNIEVKICYNKTITVWEWSPSYAWKTSFCRGRRNKSQMIMWARRSVIDLTRKNSLARSPPIHWPSMSHFVLPLASFHSVVHCPSSHQLILSHFPCELCTCSDPYFLLHHSFSFSRGAPIRIAVSIFKKKRNSLNYDLNIYI